MKEFMQTVSDKLIIRERSLIVHEDDVLNVLLAIKTKLSIEKLDEDVECKEMFITFFATNERWTDIIKALEDIGLEMKLVYPGDVVVLRKV